MTVGLRWEATGVTGGLFPALDADIRINAEERESVTVTAHRLLSSPARHAGR